jgi:hypothetical protein
MPHLIPAVFQGPFQNILKNVCAEVSDMNEVVYRGTARIKTNPAFVERVKNIFSARESIIERYFLQKD